MSTQPLGERHRLSSPDAETHIRPLTVDVVICTYTDARWELLCRAVASVQQQTAPVNAILLCVDHNDDLYERCLRQWPADGQRQTPAVRVLRNRFDGRLGSARNTAVERADASIIAFLDDDAQAEPTWVATLLEVFRQPAAVAVGGAPLPSFETSRPGWFPPEFDWVFGCHYRGLPESLAPVRHLIGASMAVRTEALRSVGGFHSDDHDDMDLSHRIAGAFGAASVLYEPRARISHFVPAQRVTWTYFWRRCYTINRSKVRAFSDMEEAGNLGAELAFARAMVGTVISRLFGGLRGKPDLLGQAGAIIAGLAVAAIGHARGRVELRAGLLPTSKTVGLQGP
ncbi:MAG TPA: glycosyltransferase [Propionibacteriaceae bacterium]|nr:glycosyltransferase [Propionibacteriaceae bacterium]